MNPAIAIDSEFAALCPKQSDEELAILTESIKTEGCRDAIVYWATKGNPILDGMTRYRLAKEYRKPFRTMGITLPDRHAAVLWILRNQLGRRNLTDAQRTIALGRLYNEVKGERGGDHKSKCQNGTLISAADDLAERHGVSPHTVKRAGEVAEAVEDLAAKSPALAAAVEAGQIPVGHAAALAEQPKSELRKIEKQTGPELREAVREVVKPPKSGATAHSAKVWHEVTAALGILKNRIDAVHNTQPHTNNKRQIMGHLDAVEKILDEWKRAG